MRPSRRALGAVALVVLICLAVPAGASGAVLTRLNNSLFFQDFDGEVNQVTFGLSGGNHTFTDTGAPIDTDFGTNGGDGNLQNDECAPVPADSAVATNSATCPAQAGDLLTLSLDVGDDSAAPEGTVPTPAAMCGGTGSDNLTGGAGADFILGEDGRGHRGGGRG